MTLATFDMKATSRIMRATKFSTEAHCRQTRNHGVPYATHPMSVADMALSYPPLQDDPEVIEPYTQEELVVAILLHDVPEDCCSEEKPLDYWSQEIRLRFGENVRELTLQLRNPSKDFPKKRRHERKRIDRDHYASGHVSMAGLLAKLFDRADNCFDMRPSAGSTFEKAFLCQYADESSLMVREGIMAGLKKHCDAMPRMEKRYRTFLDGAYIVCLSAIDQLRTEASE